MTSCHRECEVLPHSRWRDAGAAIPMLVPGGAKPLPSDQQPAAPISGLSPASPRHREPESTLLSVSPGSPSRTYTAASNSAVYRLRVVFVMTFLQIVLHFTTLPGFDGARSNRLSIPCRTFHPPPYAPTSSRQPNATALRLPRTGGLPHEQNSYEDDASFTSR